MEALRPLQAILAARRDMSQPPIFRQAWEHLTQHPPTQETPMTVLHNLIADIEHDLGTNAEVAHHALTHHLTLHNVAGHVADMAERLARPPTAQLLESVLGLPPDAQAIVTEIAAALASRLGPQAQLQPAAPDADGQPA